MERLTYDIFHLREISNVKTLMHAHTNKHL